MASYRKYMFDLDFDRPAHSQPAAVVEEEPEQPPEPEPEPPPMFSEEELAFARESAFEEGRQAGFGEAQQQTERQTAAALAALADQMATLFRQQDEANEANSHAAVRVAQAVLKKVLPGACEKHSFEEVTRVVEEVVGHILDEPRIIVKVAEPLVAAVRERLEAACQAHGFEGRVVVQADPRLNVGDCRVEWTDGGAERDQARLLQEIEATVERALAPPERRVEAASSDFAGT
ncbi:MAG TPA: FliH/SctL family protein [Magnetospirillum sp.]|nr:FliH/SctL family protein [Magnetospirillum sp.]